MKGRYERIQKLAKDKVVSVEDIAKAEVEFRLAVATVEIHEARIEKAQVEYKRARLILTALKASKK